MHITAKYFDNVYEFDVEPTDWLLSLKKKISVNTGFRCFTLGCDKLEDR